MKKASKKRMRVISAKNSALGRILCRLFGDQSGQTMMEYIVLAVLLVAATVGMVVVFGRQMKAQWYTAMLAMMGKTEKAAENQTTTTGQSKGDAGRANDTGNTIDGGTAENDGTRGRVTLSE